MEEKKKNYRVDKKVVINLVKNSLAKIEGIYSLKKNLWREEIKIKEKETEMEIELGLIVKEGCYIPQIVQQAQKDVKEEIEKTLGIPVTKINIRIRGIKSLKRTNQGG